MRKLVVLTFMSLDGIMQAPGGPKEDQSGKFTLGGWSVGYWDDTLGSVMGEQMGKPYDLLLGRKTYDIFAAYWPSVTDPAQGGDINKAKKYVASKKLKKAAWQNSQILKGDVVKEVKKLKAMNGPEIQVHGSSNFAQTLFKNDLVDEIKLKIFPVTLGKGKRLFAKGTISAGWKLQESKVSTTGVIVASYVRDGKVKVGSF